MSRRLDRLGLVLCMALAGLLTACGGEQAEADPVPGRAGAEKTVPQLRAVRRAYDGAPPVIPHTGFAADCTTCHDERGVAVEGLGFAPPSPHARTQGMGKPRCVQCHVERQTDELFVASTFVGLPQDLRSGPRQHPLAPPGLPHPLLMRENCQACHTGPAAREEIRTSHPERENCLQCHLARQGVPDFTR